MRYFVSHHQNEGVVILYTLLNDIASRFLLNKIVVDEAPVEYETIYKFKVGDACLRFNDVHNTVYSNALKSLGDNVGYILVVVA